MNERTSPSMNLKVNMFTSIVFMLLFLHKVQSDCNEATFNSNKIFFCNENKVCTENIISGCVTESEVLQDTVWISVKSEVKQLKPGAFQNLNLLVLELPEIKIQSISPGAFINIKGGPILNLAYSDLRIIKYGVFTNSSFSFIKLSFNFITEIEEDAFANMPNLNGVILYNNRLKSIKNWFKGSYNLKYLDFKYNKIKSIASDTFYGLTNLHAIDMSYNKIKVLPPNLFKGLNLYALGLMHNEIAELSGEHFDFNVSVTILQIGMNKISYLPRNFLDAANITKLFLHPNPLSCPCLYDIEKWAHTQNSSIEDFYSDPHLNWNENYPICVMPINDSKVCVYNQITKEDGYINYLKIINYNKIATEYAKAENFLY